MERKLRAREFDRLDGGRSISYEDEQGRQLAYLDYYDDGVEVVVFRPYEGHSRGYSKRASSRAVGILQRHLAAEGYDLARAITSSTAGQGDGPIHLQGN